MGTREDMPMSMTKPADLPTMKPGTNTSFGSLKQINAGILNIRHAEEPGERRSTNGYVREIGDFPVKRPICHVPTQRRFVMDTQTHATTPTQFPIRPFRVNIPEEAIADLRR